MRPQYLAFLVAAALHCSLAPPVSRAAEWHAQLPQQWLCVLAVNDLKEFEDRGQTLLDDLGFQSRGLVAAVRLIVSDAPSQAPLVLGAAQGDSGLIPFALVPAADFEAFVEATGGERTGDQAIVTIAGIELAAAPADQWALVVSTAHSTQLLASRDVRAEHQQTTAGHARAPLERAPLELYVSPLGVDAIERLAKATPAGAGRYTQHLQLAWPPTLEEVSALVESNARFLEAAAQRFDSIRLGVSLTEEGDLTIEAAARTTNLASNSPTPEPTPESTPKPTQSRDVHGHREAEVLLDGGEPIAAIAGRFGTPLSETLSELYLAYLRSHPESVGAGQYAEEQFNAFEAAVRAATESALRVTAVIRQRNEGDPLVTNQAAIVEATDADAMLENLDAAVDRWNELAMASRGDLPLLFERSDEVQDGVTARTYSIDMIAAVGGPAIPEIVQSMERFFGPGGKLAFRVIEAPGERLLISYLPKQATFELAARVAADARTAESEGPGEPLSADSWRLTLDLARYVGWRQQMTGELYAGAIGMRTPEPMPAAPPISVEASEEGDSVMLRIQAPRQTIIALGDYLRANRRDR